MRRSYAVLAIVVALAAWIGLTARPSDRSLYPPRAADAVVPLYLIDNGVHSDVALPRQALMMRPHTVARAAAMTSGDPWIVIGWGDARFYSAEGSPAARAGDAVRALFWPHNASVVRLEGIPRPPDVFYVDGAVKIIRLSPAGVERLLDRIDRSLVVGADGAPIRARLRSGPQSTFFESGETFNLLHLCNHWTAELLSAAGLPTAPVIDTLPAGLKLDLRLRSGVR